MRCHGNSGTPRQQQQQQAVDFGDEEEELLRDHEQSLRQLEVSMMSMLACTQHGREQFSSDYQHLADLLSQFSFLFHFHFCTFSRIFLV